MKVCDSSSSNPSGCAQCSMHEDVVLGGFNDWYCGDAEGSMIYISNNHPQWHYVVGCEVEVVGTKV